MFTCQAPAVGKPAIVPSSLHAVFCIYNITISGGSMTKKDDDMEGLLQSLGERAKELNCLYRIEELVSNPLNNLDAIFQGTVEAVPDGWQYPHICCARILYRGGSFQTANWTETKQVQRARIIVQNQSEGIVEVGYIADAGHADEGPFLKEERKLINTIAERLSNYILHQRLKNVFHEWQVMKQEFADKRNTNWKVVLEMLRNTDQDLFLRISRKMLNHLCWSGVPEAGQLFHRFSASEETDEADNILDSNKPQQREELNNFIKNTNDIFVIASNHLSEEEIISYIQKWIKDDKTVFLTEVLERLDTSLSEIAEAVNRYRRIAPDGIDLSPASEKGLRVSLVRRFFTETLRFINVAKHHVHINDFYDLIKHIIYHQNSHGKLGGKSAGLFLATQILRTMGEKNELLANIRVPKTWYIPSDGILDFIHYNNLEDVFNQKYLDVDNVREEYPRLVQVFKNSYFSPEIMKGLSIVLDDLGNRPIIVRSSSLLEDSITAAFSGKYKSLFLANRGTKKERLSELMDAIAEVYASTFGPDPIEYRAEKGLLDFHEEMGIMIQEVVGTKVGHYVLPAYSGVAFSNNEFRWSPRIKREDGLIRMVPGLGTRAVDRVSDDYPLLIAPGQPGLRVNITPDEVLRYSPKKIDVINLETKSFETIGVHELLLECGDHYPILNKLVSICNNDDVRDPVGFNFDISHDTLAMTFNGLLNTTTFVRQINEVLQTLQSEMGTPVDIEFASDGEALYLLQCRPQIFAERSGASPIPHDIPYEKIVFTGKRYISNGSVPDITHIVYVDPKGYSHLSQRSDMLAIGRAVGKLNNLLPKRQFILMGPGRWGSRGDIRLGVSVSYSDINNTAMLVEIARKQGNYLPDLSFGTHFFQDLVEASIRYLPLYPDDEGIIFNEAFLSRSHNILSEILPEFDHLTEYISVIDVPSCSNGNILRILLNADLDEAIGFLAPPGRPRDKQKQSPTNHDRNQEDAWMWRLRMAERIASHVDAERFGVKAMYVFGSTKNATAGPGSDIDLLVHVGGSSEQTRDLGIWLDGWNSSLSEYNYLRTGHRVEHLLDIHIVTDEDIQKRSSFAVKIDAVTDAARPLRVGRGL
jgi:predicted nucleotidyltransferase